MDLWKWCHFKWVSYASHANRLRVRNVVKNVLYSGNGNVDRTVSEMWMEINEKERFSCALRSLHITQWP